MTLDYTKPSVNPIQDLASNPAAALSRQFVANAASGDNRAPRFQSATVNADEAVLTYDEPLDPASTPEATAYKWTVDGGADLGVNGVTVAGRTVTLTLASTPTATQAIAVKYTKPTGANAKPLQDYAGNAAAGFSGGVAATNATGDSNKPKLTRAVVNRKALTLAYNKKLDTDSVPAAGAFTVTVDGSEVDAVAVSVGATAVTLTLVDAVPGGGNVRVTLDYDPTGDPNPIQDEAGRDAAALSGQFVGNTNAGDTGAPELRRATVSGTSVVLAYHEPLDPAAVPPVSAFSAARGGNDLGVNSVKVAERMVTLTMAASAAAGEDVEVTYRRPTGANVRKIQDYAGNAAAGFPSGTTATNVDGDTEAPALTRAAVDGATLTLTYGEGLDPLSVPAGAAFEVRVNRRLVQLAASNPVSVGGMAVTLTLAQAVAAGCAGVGGTTRCRPSTRSRTWRATTPGGCPGNSWATRRPGTRRRRCCRRRRRG